VRNPLLVVVGANDHIRMWSLA